MVKFFERMGMFGRKDVGAERVEEAAPVTEWDALKEVAFAGDQLAESETGGGTYREIEESLEQAPNDTLAALKDFFRLDMATKDAMMQLAPEEADMYSEDSRIDYADRVFRGYKDMEWRFLKINDAFSLTPPETIEKFFDEGEKKFAISNYDVESVKGLYWDNVSRMRPEFVEEVKEQCFGYGLNDSGEVLKQATSVNELLHACHSAIMNNEEILKKVPAIDAKRAGTMDAVVLRGDENAIGRQIFEAIPEEIDAGPIDIVSVDERAIMMVRDRGHALLVQAEEFESGSEKVVVNYSIPKIINREMVEQLPGVDKITDEGANGRFLCAADEVGVKVKDFIEMVPTDADMKF